MTVEIENGFSLAYSWFSFTMVSSPAISEGPARDSSAT